MLEGLQRLEKLGHMSCCSTPEGAQVWAKTLSLLADEYFKFALNSSVDTLPHNANLHLWKKRGSSACTLCGEDQSLIKFLHRAVSRIFMGGGGSFYKNMDLYG